MTAAQPSSRLHRAPHQLQRSDPSTASDSPRWLTACGSSSSRATRPARSCSTAARGRSTPTVTGLDIELERFDLSLDNRRETDNGVVTEAAAAMAEARFGLKAATVTPEGKDDVGSPNRILREAIDGKVIIRTGRRIPGVNAGRRRAPPDLGGPHGRRRRLRRRAVARGGGRRRVRLRTEKISRTVCKAVAEYSFRTAERIEGKVYGGPKWTVSPVYEGMLKEEMDAAAERHPEVEYEPVLIDATYAGLITGAADCAAGDPRAEPRRRLPVGPGACRCSARSPARSRCCWRWTTTTSPAAVMAEAPHGTAPGAC